MKNESNRREQRKRCVGNCMGQPEWKRKLKVSVLVHSNRVVYSICQHDAKYETKQERVGDERERASESTHMGSVVRDDSQTGTPFARLSEEHN